MAQTYTYKNGEVWPDNPKQLEDWNEGWKERRIGFHRDEVHPYLAKYWSRLVGQTSCAKIFFPLCGKDVGMSWAHEQGHCVVGVESSVIGIEEFFKESAIEYTVEDAPSVNGKVYKSKDGRCRIYNCDLFAFNSSVEGKFDGIWDRGALVAINKADRQKYADVLMSLMGDDCCYLITTVKYNPQEHAGPPHYVPDDQLPDLYGTKCKIEFLEKQEKTEDVRWLERGLSEFLERIHLLTPI